MNTQVAALFVLGATALGACAPRLVTRESDGLLAADAPAPLPTVWTEREFMGTLLAESTLPNGLRVVVVDRPGFPTLSTRLIVRAGHDATDGRPELAELVARTLRDGTGTLSGEQITQRIDSEGISFAATASANAVTIAADGLADSYGAMVELVAGVAIDSTLADLALADRRLEYAGELRSAMATPDYHKERLLRRTLFGEHTYGAMATPEAVEAIAPEVARDFYARTWGPSRATLLVVGAVPHDARAVIEREFGAWNRPVEPYTTTPPAPVSLCNAAWVVERPNSAQTVIVWAAGGRHVTQDGFFDAVLANHILGGGITGRLAQNLRERQSFTYRAISQNQQRYDVAVFVAESSVRSDVTEPALREFEVEFDRLDGTAFDGAELGAAQDYLAGVFPIRIERNAGLAAEIGTTVGLDLPLAYLDTYRDNVRSVTPDGAATAGADLVDRDTLGLFMVGEPEVVRAAAPRYASHVYVYDLEGNLIDELAGERPSTCP